MTQRTVTKNRRNVHDEWLALVDIGGPFLSKPVLIETWPDLTTLTGPQRDALRQAHREWRGPGDLSWLHHLLQELLGWSNNLTWDADGSFRLSENSGSVRLLGVTLDVHPTARIPDTTETPIDRVASMCREGGVPLGLTSDGRRLALVHAEPGQAVSHVMFDTVGWNEAAERPTVRAFLSLLERRRFFAVPDDERLPTLFERSRNNQEELTEALGSQVRQATELLVESIGRVADEDFDVDAAEVYRAATTVLMRVLFLLWAEQCGLMPSGNDIYEASYSATGLCDELEARANRETEETLEGSHAGWFRLLALFAAIAHGSEHPALEMTAYDGSMFDPEQYPWLENHANPLRIDDRTVLHILRSITYVVVHRERRRLSFKALQVEQIGYVYEGLLAYTARRATGTTVRLAGRPGQEAEVTLDRLEELAAAHPHDLPEALSEAFHKKYGIGTPGSVAKKLGGSEPDARRYLLAVTRGNGLEAERLLPWYGLLHKDLRRLPSVIPDGGLFVTESSLRDDSGTHYTPPELAAEIAEGTLSPLVHDPGPLQTADRSAWKVKPSEEILRLKVADIAMGSGALLVAAVRYLAEAVLKAWEREGRDKERDEQSVSSVDMEVDPQTVAARRLVIERCIYGADINPAAVELGKLSLWLISMDRWRPFTFIDDKLVSGDSLLGVTHPDQIQHLHLDRDEGIRIHGGTLVDYTSGTRELLEELADKRRAIAAISTDGLVNVREKRELLREVHEATVRLTVIADLVIAATLQAYSQARRTDEPYLAAAERLHRGEIHRWLSVRPLHWCLEFPEVFWHGGFDAILGNPPYLGGQRLTRELGTSYREYLVGHLGRGVRGSADRSAYFLLRATGLVNTSGQLGFVVTNTLAQGSTRRVGLDQVVAGGATIRESVKSMPWPTGAGVEVCIVCLSCAPVSPSGEWRVNRTPAPCGPTTRLDLYGADPFRLRKNTGVAFQGAIILGLGFTMQPEKRRHLVAMDPKYEEVLRPYPNGKDLNSRPGGSASRFVIDFQDWPKERAAREFPLAFTQVESLVRPERQRKKRKLYREVWWRFAERRPGLCRAIQELDEVIALARVSSVVQPLMVPARQVFSDALVVFASNDPALLAVLSGAAHQAWTKAHCSTLETRIRYTPTSIFRTFPCPTHSHQPYATSAIASL